MGTLGSQNTLLGLAEGFGLFFSIIFITLFRPYVLRELCVLAHCNSSVCDDQKTLSHAHVDDAFSLQTLRGDRQYMAALLAGTKSKTKYSGHRRKFHSAHLSTLSERIRVGEPHFEVFHSESLWAGWDSVKAATEGCSKSAC